MALDYGSGGTFSVRMEGPFGSVGATAKLTTFTAPAANWKGAVSPYSQEVTVDGISVSSKVDIQLTPEEVNKLRSGCYSFLAGNDNGVVTLYAIGDKPSDDLTFQATVMEVTA